MSKNGEKSSTPHSPEFTEPLPLSFVTDGPKGRNFWTVEETGKLCLDQALGTGLALELLAYLRRSADHSVLGWIVCDMLDREEFGPVEVGFFHALSKFITQGSLP